MPYDIVTIGDTKLDTFVVLPDGTPQCRCVTQHRRRFLCLEHGAKIPVRDFAPQIAGSAANVAVGMARLGYRAAIATMLGIDGTARLAQERFTEEGVSQQYVRAVRGARSSSSVVITYEGERTILAAHQPHRFRLPTIRAARWLYLSELGENYHVLFQDVLRAVARGRMRLAFNPGAVQLGNGARALKPMLKATTMLFVNREEGRTLINHRANTIDLRHLVTALWKLGPGIVVVTDGARGAYAFDGGNVLHCPPFPSRLVEMTGAGDSFAVGFLAAHMTGKPIADALRWGAANAASVVAHVGPQPGLLTKTAMARALRANATTMAAPL